MLGLLHVRLKIILYHELFSEFPELMLVSPRVLAHHSCSVLIDKSSNKLNHFTFFADQFFFCFRILDGDMFALYLNECFSPSHL